MPLVQAGTAGAEYRHSCATAVRRPSLFAAWPFAASGALAIALALARTPRAAHGGPLKRAPHESTRARRGDDGRGRAVACGYGCTVDRGAKHAFLVSNAGLHTPGARSARADPTDTPIPGGGSATLLVALPPAPAAGAPGAPTAGTLTVEYDTQSLLGRYEPRNCTAVWIETAQDQYVATLEIRAGLRRPGLVYWQDHACTDKPGPDVMTSATLADHSRPHMTSWSGVDFESKQRPMHRTSFHRGERVGQGRARSPPSTSPGCDAFDSRQRSTSRALLRVRLKWERKGARCCAGRTLSRVGAARAGSAGPRLRSLATLLLLLLSQAAAQDVAHHGVDCGLRARRQRPNHGRDPGMHLGFPLTSAPARSRLRRGRGPARRRHPHLGPQAVRRPEPTRKSEAVTEQRDEINVSVEHAFPTSRGRRLPLLDGVRLRSHGGIARRRVRLRDNNANLALSARAYFDEVGRAGDPGFLRDASTLSAAQPSRR